MLKVTEAAQTELKRIYDERELPPGRYLRLAVPPRWHEAGDFGLVIDEQEQGDRALAVDGTKVMLIDPELERKLDESVFDFKDTPQGEGFTLDVY